MRLTSTTTGLGDLDAVATLVAATGRFAPLLDGRSGDLDAQAALVIAGEILRH